MYNFRTDMADERVDIYKASHDMDGEVSGIRSSKNVINEHIEQNIVDVLNNEAEKYIGKVKGRYITFDLKDLMYASYDEVEETAKIISKDLKKLVDEKIQNSTGDILIVGLGNQFSTPDSLGPKVISEIEITRHLKKYAPQYLNNNTKTISAIAPGVLGTTGIESIEIIRGIVDNIKPDVIIAIDSLASKSIKRISSSIQMCNTGIVPGSGVDNKRCELSEVTLGVPVISVGVPMVVDLETIVEECLNTTKVEFDYEKIKSALVSENLNMVVTPKEVDDMVENMKCIIAKCINYAL